jgi:hypothetical protein
MIKNSEVIYLDTGFIALAYEDIEAKSAPTKIVKSEEMSGKASAGLFGFNATTCETKEFPISSFQMYITIRDKLLNIPTVKIVDSIIYPNLFWVEGYLGIGLRSNVGGKSDGKEYYHFSISANAEGGSPSIDLVTSDTFFTPGFDKFAEQKDMLGIHFWRHVRCLLRFISGDKHNKCVVAAPMIILVQP